MHAPEDFTIDNINARGIALASAFGAAGIPPDRLTVLALIAVIDALLVDTDEIKNVAIPWWVLEWRKVLAARDAS